MERNWKEVTTYNGIDIWKEIVLCHYHSQSYSSLSRMNILLLFLVFALVFYYEYSLYPNVTTVIDSTSLFLSAPFLIRSVYPPKRINYWKANQYAYASFHGSLPDDEITQCNDICGSVIPYTIVLIPSAQGVWSAVMESTIRFSPSDSLWRTKRWKPWWMRSKSSLLWPNTSRGSDLLLLVQMQMVNEKQVIHA